MVSFRLSWQEYRTYLELCQTAGVRSLSELARAAMRQLVVAHQNNGTPLYGMPLDEQVRDLRNQVSILTREVDRLTRHQDQHAELVGGHA